MVEKVTCSGASFTPSAKTAPPGCAGKSPPPAPRPASPSSAGQADTTAPPALPPKPSVAADPSPGTKPESHPAPSELKNSPATAAAAATTTHGYRPSAANPPQTAKSPSAFRRATLPTKICPTADLAPAP